MKVYIDVILLLNFGFDFLLLLSVSYLLKRNVKLKKIILGALFGSLSTLLLFLNINTFTLFIIKLIISFFMTIISFYYKNIRYTIKNMIHLYLNSIILGGFLYLINIEFSYKHVGLIFYHNGLSINFILLIILSPIIIYLYTKQIRSLRIDLKQYYKVSFTLKKQYNFNGFLDTGNKLKSVYFKKNINIINKDLIKEELDYFYEPITTVNGTGIMKCFIVDTVYLDDFELHNVIFGISTEYLKLDVDIILNSRIWEETNVKVD